jgi:hypothetical protein
MAKQASEKSVPKAKAVVVKAAKSVSSIRRSRRSAMMRKCLSKSAKRQFAGMGTAMMSLLLAAEQTNRKYVGLTREKVID